MSEHDEQAALIEWADWLSARHPRLAMLFAIPNGGARHKAVASRMKAEGVRRGVPDLFLPVCGVNGAAGLWIEMKTTRGRLSPEQLWWRDHLRDHYDYVLCRNWQDAARAICAHLGIDAEAAGVAPQEPS